MTFENTIMLNFKTAKAADSGSYKCVGTLDGKEYSQSIQLNVVRKLFCCVLLPYSDVVILLETPNWVDETRVAAQMIQQALHIDCNAKNGHPPPEIVITDASGRIFASTSLAY